jgi:hypothetical protein
VENVKGGIHCRRLKRFTVESVLDVQSHSTGRGWGLGPPVWRWNDWKVEGKMLQRVY